MFQIFVMISGKFYPQLHTTQIWLQLLPMLTKQNLLGKKNWVEGNFSFSFVACDFSIQSLPTVTYAPTLIYPCLHAAVVFFNEWLWRLMEQIPIYLKANLGLAYFLTDCKNALQCLWAGLKKKNEAWRYLYVERAAVNCEIWHRLTHWE